MVNSNIPGMSTIFFLTLVFFAWPRSGEATRCYTEAQVSGGQVGPNNHVIRLFEQHVRDDRSNGIRGYCDSCSNSNLFCVTLRLQGRIQISGLAPGQGSTSNWPPFGCGQAYYPGCEHDFNGPRGKRHIWNHHHPSHGGGQYDSVIVESVTYKSCDFGLIYQRRGHWHGWICERLTGSEMYHKRVPVCQRDDGYPWGGGSGGYPNQQCPISPYRRSRRQVQEPQQESQEHFGHQGYGQGFMGQDFGNQGFGGRYPVHNCGQRPMPPQCIVICKVNPTTPGCQNQYPPPPPPRPYYPPPPPPRPYYPPPPPPPPPPRFPVSNCGRRPMPPECVVYCRQKPTPPICRPHPCEVDPYSPGCRPPRPPPPPPPPPPPRYPVHNCNQRPQLPECVLICRINPSACQQQDPCAQDPYSPGCYQPPVPYPYPPAPEYPYIGCTICRQFQLNNARFATPHLISQGYHTQVVPGVQMYLHSGLVQIECCSSPKCNNGGIYNGNQGYPYPNGDQYPYQPQYPPLSGHYQQPYGQCLPDHRSPFGDDGDDSFFGPSLSLPNPNATNDYPMPVAPYDRGFVSGIDDTNMPIGSNFETNDQQHGADFENEPGQFDQNPIGQHRPNPSPNDFGQTGSNPSGQSGQSKPNQNRQPPAPNQQVPPSQNRTSQTGSRQFSQISANRHNQRQSGQPTQKPLAQPIVSLVRPSGPTIILPFQPTEVEQIIPIDIDQMRNTLDQKKENSAHPEMDPNSVDRIQPTESSDQSKTDQKEVE